MKICTFIIARFYFGFQNIFFVDVFTGKFFFYTTADFIPNIIIFLIILHIQLKNTSIKSLYQHLLLEESLWMLWFYIHSHNR